MTPAALARAFSHVGHAYIPGRLPPAFSLLTSLESLDLYNNPQLVGPLPEELADLRGSLRNIWLGDTGIAVQMAAHGGKGRVELRRLLPNCLIRLS